MARGSVNASAPQVFDLSAARPDGWFDEVLKQSKDFEAASDLIGRHTLGLALVAGVRIVSLTRDPGGTEATTVEFAMSPGAAVREAPLQEFRQFVGSTLLAPLAPQSLPASPRRRGTPNVHRWSLPTRGGSLRRSTVRASPRLGLGRDCTPVQRSPPRPCYRGLPRCDRRTRSDRARAWSRKRRARHRSCHRSAGAGSQRRGQLRSYDRDAQPMAERDLDASSYWRSLRAHRRGASSTVDEPGSARVGLRRDRRIRRGERGPAAWNPVGRRFRKKRPSSTWHSAGRR